MPEQNIRLNPINPITFHAFREILLMIFIIVDLLASSFLVLVIVAITFVEYNLFFPNIIGFFVVCSWGIFLVWKSYVWVQIHICYCYKNKNKGVEKHE